MITIFEGPRNSGKTFLANRYSKLKNSKIFKFDFVGWFNELELQDSSESTHLFALGKEAMLLQLNRDGMLPDFVLDRGFLTVLTWGILSGRITEDQAHRHLIILAEKGLLKDCKIIYVLGQNPNKDTRNKDNWDHVEESGRERDVMENLRDFICNQPYNVETIFVHNPFNDSVNLQLEKI